MLWYPSTMTSNTQHLESNLPPCSPRRNTPSDTLVRLGQHGGFFFYLEREMDA